MSWIDLLVDSSAIRAVFGEELPTLNKVDLHELSLHRDGPRVSLRFDLSVFPTSPPKKWAALGFNRVQLKLLAVGAHDLAVKGWGSECKCDITISPDNGKLILQAKGRSLEFSMSTDSLFLDGVNAYLEK